MPRKILAFAGSARRDSYNVRLLRLAIAGARDAGAEVTLLDMDEHRFPIFDEDAEARHGPPAEVTAFKSLMKAHDAFLIASPEYNSTFSPLLKNTIDWATRPAPGEKPLECFRGKVAGLVSASPGYYGGYRGLQQVRYVLGNIGVIVLPDMFALPKAHEAFDAAGSLKDAKSLEMARAIGATLAKFQSA
ncbi:MAG: NAD(P)H-dependent oxidoreductase [Phycisphaeraceae bacterium]|nr:MAG: NAD(P)H-dependent oxidoreductase [Phycisphaeraceae bacterium]